MTQPPQPQFGGNARFEILSRIGAGGMGVVYAAYDRERQTRVALKTVKQATPEALLRLKREFRALADLSHPNLVSLGELHEESGLWFFTMELVDGVDFIKWVSRPRGPRPEDGERPATMMPPAHCPDPDGEITAPAKDVPRRPAATVLEPSSDSLEPRGAADESSEAPTGHVPSSQRQPFDEARLRHGLRQLAEGLAALHKAGRVHRDIKPSNILVTPEGRVVLLDFGLVSDLHAFDEETGGHLPMGTAAYMAPEQVTGQRVGPEADWYGVGVVLFRALTRELPFTGTQERILARKQLEAAPRPSSRGPEVPVDLDSLAVALLERDPARRPTGPEVLTRLTTGQATSTHVSTESGPVSAADSTSLSPSRTFVGRQEELGKLRAALQNVTQGRSAAVLVHSASGLGKSEFIKAFVRELRLQDPTPFILSGRCHEQENVPFKAFDGVVDSLSRLLVRLPKEETYRVAPRDASLLVRMFPVLGRVEALASAPKPRQQIRDLQERRARTFGALREILSRMADMAPLVLIIDDLHWADADSLRLLRALLAPPEAPLVLVVLSLRTPQGDSAARPADSGAWSRSLGIDEIRDVLPEPLVEIAVAPLSRQDSRTLASRLIRAGELGSDPRREDLAGEDLADRVARESGGHPLFIQEMVRHIAARGYQGVEDTRLEDAILARLADLEPELRETLEVLAVAGGPIRQDHLGEAASLDPSTVSRHLTRLRLAHLVRTRGPRPQDRVETYHDRIRLAVLGGLAPDQIRAWHDRLATALLTSVDPEPEQLATFLEGAGKLQLAARYLTEAADHASRTLAFDRAAHLYERALGHDSEPEGAEEREERRQLWIRLGDARAHAGRGRQAAEAYHAAEKGAPAAEILDLKRRAAEQLLRSGHVTDGLRVTREVLEALKLRWPKSPTGALLSLLWRRMLLRLRGMGFRERDASLIDAETLLRVDICYALSTGLAVADHIRGADFSSRVVGYALKSGEPNRVLRALCLEAAYAAATLNTRHLERVLGEAETLMAKHNDPAAPGYVDGALGYRAYMEGRFREALEHSEAAERHLFEQAQLSYERATVRFVGLWSLFYLGRWNQLAQRAIPFCEEAMDRGDRYAAMGISLGLNSVAWLITKGPEKTREHVRSLLAGWNVEGYHLQHFYGLLAEAQIDLYTGDPRAAHARMVKDWPPLKRSLLLKIPSVALDALHLRARSAAAAALVSSGDERAPLLAEARHLGRRLARRRHPWPRSLAELVLAAVDAQEGRTQKAIARLEAVVEELDRQEIKLFAAAACFQLAGLVEKTRGTELRAQAEAVLTEEGCTEPARVVALLAPGFPSPELA